MDRRLLLIGAGGHAASVMDCALASGLYEDVGVVEKNADAAGGITPVGCDEDLPRLFEEGWTDAFVTVGSIGNTAVREKLARLIEEIGFFIPVIADPSAVVSPAAVIGPGTFVGKRAVVNTGTVIGRHAIVNTGAVIEHDCRIGDFCHISPGTVLCGKVYVEDRAHVGAGSVVRQGIRIGARALVGAGSAVVKDVPAGVTAFGNPCRIIR